VPYIRKGKCVYRKDTGKKVGCSETVEEAKEYIKALYANADDEETFIHGVKTVNEELSFDELVNIILEKAKPKKKSKLRSKCQAKAKAKYDVWPSAYASGYVQRCVRRVGKIG
jgi:hypothetical protein